MAEYIKKFWDSQAVKHKQAASASWADNFAVDLEIEAIKKHIGLYNKVLDVGCANGHATIRQASSNFSINITGVDYSEEMIKQANKALENTQHLGAGNISFSVADITKLPFKDGEFDLTYTTRVLINLPTWEEQLKGINECLRVTKKGGKVILSEAFYEPLALLNSMRNLKQLPPLEEHDFNRYIKKYRLDAYLKDSGLNFECDDFSSIYYFGSRFLRELVTNIDDYEGYSNPINKEFYKLEKAFNGGGFGIQQAYIITK